MTSSTTALPQSSTTVWDIDPAHTVAEFKVKHMMIANVKGHFSKVSGVLTLDESKLPSSRVEATIEAASIETRDGQRDAHLKSADFFDVEKFPTLHFKSTSISLIRDGELAVEGDLTIRGVTRKVRLAVEGPTPPTKDPWGNTRVGVSATTKINRKDFGLTWNSALESGGILVATTSRSLWRRNSSGHEGHEEADEEPASLPKLASASFGPAVSTSRMGVDKLAVVDPELRVHAILGLRVVDTSVMPQIITGPGTNASAHMIAGRAANVVTGNFHSLLVPCSIPVPIRRKNKD